MRSMSCSHLDLRVSRPPASFRVCRSSSTGVSHRTSCSQRSAFVEVAGIEPTLAILDHVISGHVPPLDFGEYRSVGARS